MICYTGRVLAGISKMPVQNNIYKISAHPDLSTQPLQSLVTTTFNSLCQKGQFPLLRWWVFVKKNKVEHFSSKDFACLCSKS